MRQFGLWLVKQSRGRGPCVTKGPLMTSNVTVRALAAHDAACVSRIWVQGLDQSKLAVAWVFRRWFISKMNGMRDAALANTGDVGPNGCNLITTYDGKPDRRMFVACMGPAQTVVGCCAVKIGMDETKAQDDSDTCSIWRMSVDATARGRGVATKLVTACEDWSRAAGRHKMGLYTINPVAADFYVKRMGYHTTDHFHPVNNRVAKWIVPPVYKYEKSLS